MAPTFPKYKCTQKKEKNIDEQKEKNTHTKSCKRTNMITKTQKHKHTESDIQTYTIHVIIN